MPIRLSPLSVGLVLLFAQPLFAEDVTIGFEGPPTQPSGTHYAVAQYDEAGFHFQPQGALATQPPYHMGRVGPATALRPDNGTTHLALLYGDSCVVTRSDSGPFRVRSIQLAEYSTVVSDAKTVTFTGYKWGGGTVTVSFTTDGVIDGPGGGADFQTFEFPDTFSGLARLEFTDIAAYDNLALTTETPPEPPAPELLSFSPVTVAINIASHVPAAGSSGNLSGTPARITLGNARIIAAARERGVLPAGDWALYVLYEREILDQQPGRWVFEARKATGERVNLNEIISLTALGEVRAYSQRKDAKSNNVKGTLTQEGFLRNRIDLAGELGEITAYGKVSIAYTLSGTVARPEARTKAKQAVFSGYLENGSIATVTLSFGKWLDGYAPLLP